MFDALKLLGSMTETNTNPAAANRFGAAVQQNAQGGRIVQQLLGQLGTAGQPGGANLLGSLLGQGGSATAPGQPAQGGLGGVLGVFSELAKRAAASPRQEVEGNNPVAIGGLGSLAGALLGGGRGALGGGLMAVLGSLGYAALQSQAGAGAGSPSGARAPAGAIAFGAGPGAAAPMPAMPANDAEMQRRAVLLIRAMIQAAKADGQIDEAETQRIMSAVASHGHGDEARNFVVNEMRQPIDIPSLVRDVGSPQEAVEVYSASLMAIQVDTQAEQNYLADLAQALQLPGPAVAHIHQTLGVPL
jgi:uncharacterized membrane protein YebE (DUF533 family)